MTFMHDLTDNSRMKHSDSQVIFILLSIGICMLAGRYVMNKIDRSGLLTYFLYCPCIYIFCLLHDFLTIINILRNFTVVCFLSKQCIRTQNGQSSILSALCPLFDFCLYLNSGPLRLDS